MRSATRLLALFGGGCGFFGIAQRHGLRAVGTAGIIRFLFRRLSHRGGRPVLRERRRYLLLCCPGTGGGTDLVCRRIGPGGGVICGHASLRGAHSLVGAPGGQLRAPLGGQITADNYPPSRGTPTLRPGRSARLNLLLTISEHHRTSPPGHACGPSPHSSRRRLFDLSAWWSKRHVGRQRPPRGKSAFRIQLDDCWRLCGRLADGGCDYLGLLLNLRGAHYRSRWAMQRCPRDAGGTARPGAARRRCV